jgi:hypothetical protein
VNRKRTAVPWGATDTVEILWIQPDPEGRRVEAIRGRLIIQPLDPGRVLALVGPRGQLRDAGIAEHRMRTVQGIRQALREGAGESAVPDLCVVDEDFRASKLPKGTHSA